MNSSHVTHQGLIGGFDIHARPIVYSDADISHVKLVSDKLGIPPNKVIAGYNLSTIAMQQVYNL